MSVQKDQISPKSLSSKWKVSSIDRLLTDFQRHSALVQPKGLVAHRGIDRFRNRRDETTVCSLQRHIWQRDRDAPANHAI